MAPANALAGAVAKTSAGESFLSPDQASELDAIAEKLRAAAKTLKAHENTSLSLQLRAGRDLNRAKDLAGHGHFETWAETNTPIKKSRRHELMAFATAEPYIRDALNWAGANDTKVERTARGFVRLVKKYRVAIGDAKAKPHKSSPTVKERLQAAEAKVRELTTALEAEQAARAQDAEALLRLKQEFEWLSAQASDAPALAASRRAS